MRRAVGVTAARNKEYVVRRRRAGAARITPVIVARAIRQGAAPTGNAVRGQGTLLVVAPRTLTLVAGSFVVRNPLIVAVRFVVEGYAMVAKARVALGAEP